METRVQEHQQELQRMYKSRDLGREKLLLETNLRKNQKEVCCMLRLGLVWTILFSRDLTGFAESTVDLNQRRVGWGGVGGGISSECLHERYGHT